MESMKKEKVKVKDKVIIIKYSDVLGKKISNKLPDCFSIWDKDHPQSKEYEAMMEELAVLIQYIAMKLNTGPEVSESIMKRCASLSVLFYEMLTKTCIDGYHAYGVISEIEKNLYMDIGGKQKVIELLQFMSIRAQQKMKNKVRDYTT